MARVGWRGLSFGIARLFTPHSRYPERDRKNAPRILAVVSPGPDRHLIQAIAQDSGWILTLSETLAAPTFGCPADVPPLVIYDREISPNHWHDTVRALTKKSPRPYVILLSRNADANLWDELQRVGGCDILRTPVQKDNLLWAVKKAWVLWHNQQHVRVPLPDRV